MTKDDLRKRTISMSRKYSHFNRLLKHAIPLVFICYLLVGQLSGCSGRAGTNEASVKKVITTTEYLLLNNDFNSLDSARQQKSVVKFDANDNILENLDYWQQESVFGGGMIYQYDKDNRVKEERQLNTQNKIVSRFFYEYADSTATKYEIYENGEKYKRTILYYDRSPNIVRETGIDNTGLVMYDFFYKYDAHRQETERSGVLGGKRIQTNYKVYDNRRNLIEQKSVDSNGVVLSEERFIYSDFDPKGNWTTRKSILNGSPHAIAFRIVEEK